MKRNNFFLLLALVIYGILNASHPGYEKLVNYRQAVQEFALTHDQAAFDEYKSLINRYYVSGAYEDHLRSICIKAKQYFEAFPLKENSLVVFDVDDTALYHFHIHDDFKFIWKDMPWLAQNRPLGKAPGIKPVLELYNYLIKKGFKVVFLTCRPDDVYDQTIIELHNAKFNVYEELICMPLDLAQNPSSKYGLWKYTQRERLAKKYNIVGNIGDRERDFEIGHNGYSVKLPNYLQKVYR